jgi:Tol biopolymer transport system component
MKSLRIVGIAASLVFAVRANGQQYFGQNQVQYRHFDWHILETDHFQIHYYPEERAAVVDVGRMAERAYERLSRVLDHQFREKKPIILFASRADFGQNNVTGDLGEGTGGVTEGRFRLLAPLTGDYHSFEHVLAHEMVHEFQYDIFLRGKIENVQTLEQINPPLWYMEGQAEYLSGGPDHPLTAEWLRDAAVNGTVPSIEQMTERPDKYFPYRYGESLWEYVGERWGDAAIGQILEETATIGVARAIQKELGLSLHELSDDWREAINATYLPQAAILQRPQTFATPLLTPRKSGGQIFLAPTLSQDGKYIAFLSNGSEKRGQIFIDLWLGDAGTGKRLKRLIKSTTDANFEELRLLYSQSAFSNDAKTLAFTAERNGKDVLYLLDVASGSVKSRLDLPIDAIWGPTWSPDDRQIAFSGIHGGLSDLFIVDADGKNLRQLTNDKYGDLQPQWSPDGKTLAFATERSPATNLSNLKLGPWQIATLDIASGNVTVLPDQAGLNLNPQWSPDGRSIAFISDRTGLANVFLFDFSDNKHYQLTNVLGGVSAITEFSPAISWARGADRMVFTYYERGDYTVWAVDHPASLKRYAFGTGPSTMLGYNLIHPAVSVATAPVPTGRLDSLSTPRANEPTSTYRGPAGSRQSSILSTAEIAPDTAYASVAGLLANPNFGLPDTTRFKDESYHAHLHPDYIADPSVGYTPNYGTYSGGTAFVFSDLLENHLLAVSAQVYGQLSDAAFFVGYANQSRRTQYSLGFSQTPYYVPVDANAFTNGVITEYQETDFRYVLRTANLAAQYPLNRFHRFETGLQLNNIDRSEIVITTQCDVNFCTNPSIDKIGSLPSYNYAMPSLAYVTDNSLFGMTGPITGRRMRFQLGQALGNVKFASYLADYRRYDPIIFNTLTFATRLFTLQSVGRDENLFQNYIGRPDYVRGYDRANFQYFDCTSVIGAQSQCNNAQLAGSRVAVGNIELRFPIIRRFDLGAIGLPPVDGHFFYDAGLAWNKGQSISFNKPANYDPVADTQRYAFTSAGFGLRVNVFGIAILQWDYAHPYGTARKPNWTFSLGAGY